MKAPLKFSEAGKYYFTNDLKYLFLFICRAFVAIDIYLFIFIHFLVEAFRNHLPDSPLCTIASFQVIQKCPVLLTGVNTFGFLCQPVHCWSTGSGLFLDLNVRGETNLPQKCLQLCLCHSLFFFGLICI